MNRLLTLSASEVKLLLRNRTAAVTALLMPIALGLYFIFQGPAIFGDSSRGWAMAIGLQTMMMLGFTVYITSTTALTTRRQDLYLKRLRSGEVSDGTILGGILLPIAGLGVLQSLVLLAASLIAGAPLPSSPGLLVVGVVGGAVMCMAIGAATSGLTSSAEAAQITTTPFFMAIIGSALWVLLTAPGEVSTLQLALPGGAVAELVRGSWSTGGAATQLTDSLPAIGLMLAWIAVGAIVATRVFRWEPRK